MIQRPLLALTACALLVSGASASQVTIPSPFEPAPRDVEVDGLPLRLSPASVDQIAQRKHVVLESVRLPSGESVDLELERIEHERLRFGFQVDDAARPDLLDGLSLSLWKGSVRGEPGSEVRLSFSRKGTRGWIKSGGDLVHVLARPSSSGSWSNGSVWFVEDAELVRRGARFQNDCQALPVPPAAGAPSTPRIQDLGGVLPTGGQAALGTGCGLQECRMSITSDYQLFQRFSDLDAMTAYVTTLLGFVSDTYETQASTILTFPYVAFYTTAADPWVAQDTGGNSIAVLYELQAAWGTSAPNGGHLGHLISGANLGGGVAFLDVLCAPGFNFGVSGNVDGFLPFPVIQGTANWDFIVFAHEVGHNFNALHTHDYCPPLDECAPNGYFGTCQTQQACISTGTIMSYCHLCSGGTGNVATSFHPISASYMAIASTTCLPRYLELHPDLPESVVPNTSTPVTVDVAGQPQSGVNLLWRPTPASSYQTLVMSQIAGCTYGATLPGFGCSETPDFYFTYVDTSGVTITSPPTAPTLTHGVAVGTLSTVFGDDFEANLGWTTSIAGATAGQWERGVPVNDAGWAWDPAADGDGSGSCWLTQNATGNTDVDGGSVTLESPPLDLSGPGVVLEYDYYLRLNVSNGYDALVVEATVNGSGGAWAVIARHTTDVDGTWRRNSIDEAAFAAAGVTPTNGTRIRFTANDGNPSSIVEAGVDGLRVARRGCNGVGANFCTPVASSLGTPALVTATGTASVGANNLVLRAGPVPANTLGAFYFGSGAVQVPFGNGMRCAEGPGFFLGVRPASGGGITQVVNVTTNPAAGQLVAGSTWNFQCWFRDPAAGGAKFNLSDGYRVTFAP